MEQIQDYEPIFPEQTVVYGSFWERFCASFLDGLILMIPNFLITYLFTGQIIGGGLNYGAVLVNTIIGWIYSASLESGVSQATLGKRAIGLKVTDIQGQRISFGQATGRHFGKLISALILCIGYLMMLGNDKHQTLHDKMAGTLVIKSA